MQRILLLLIRGYRYLLSPFFGSRCRFYPTCSEYAEGAVASYGAWRGGWLAARRLARCHPWHPGGFDPVPGSAQDLTGHGDARRRGP
jgi:putative membrane protein insertion efficiency factor